VKSIITLALGRLLTRFSRMTLSRMTLSRMTLSRMTLSWMTLSWMTHSRMTLSQMTLSRMTFSRMTLSRMTLSRMTLSRMTLSRMTLDFDRISVYQPWSCITQSVVHLNVVWLNVVSPKDGQNSTKNHSFFQYLLFQFQEQWLDSNLWPWDDEPRFIPLCYLPGQPLTNITALCTNLRVPITA
jgi:hypothetical protein